MTKCSLVLLRLCFDLSPVISLALCLSSLRCSRVLSWLSKASLAQLLILLLPADCCLQSETSLAQPGPTYCLLGLSICRCISPLFSLAIVLSSLSYAKLAQPGLGEDLLAYLSLALFLHRYPFLSRLDDDDDDDGDGADDDDDGDDDDDDDDDDDGDGDDDDDGDGDDEDGLVQRERQKEIESQRTKELEIEREREGNERTIQKAREGKEERQNDMLTNPLGQASLVQREREEDIQSQRKKGRERERARGITIC